jgi:hypothetical protein
MKTFIKMVAITGLCLVAIGQAQAGSEHNRGYTKHSDIKNLNQRVDWGIKSGKISHREADRLRHQQQSIRQLKRKFYADGHLSRKERQILSNRISRLNDRVYSYKHNDNYRVDKGYWNNRGYSRSYLYGHSDSRPSGTIIYRW